MFERKMGLMESEKQYLRKGGGESGHVRVGKRCGSGREGATYFWRCGATKIERVAVGRNGEGLIVEGH